MATVGNIVFCFIMMSVSLILIVESIRDIAANATSPPADGTNQFHVPAIVAVSVAFFVKLCLFCYCWGLREYPQVPPRPLIGAAAPKSCRVSVGLIWEGTYIVGGS
jgi:hypothetical protein